MTGKIGGRKSFRNSIPARFRGQDCLATVSYRLPPVSPGSHYERDTFSEIGELGDYKKLCVKKAVLAMRGHNRDLALQWIGRAQIAGKKGGIV